MSDVGHSRQNAFRKVCWSTVTKHMSQLDGCCRYGTDRCWNACKILATAPTSAITSPPTVPSPSMSRPVTCALTPQGSRGCRSCRLQLASLSSSLPCRLEMSGLTNLPAHTAGVSNAGAFAALEKRKRSQWMSGCDTNISSEIFMNKHLLGETGYLRDILMDTAAAKHRLVVG